MFDLRSVIFAQIEFRFFKWQSTKLQRNLILIQIIPQPIDIPENLVLNKIVKEDTPQRLITNLKTAIWSYMFDIWQKVRFSPLPIKVFFKLLCQVIEWRILKRDAKTSYQNLSSSMSWWNNTTVTNLTILQEIKAMILLRVSSRTYQVQMLCLLSEL